MSNNIFIRKYLAPVYPVPFFMADSSDHVTGKTNIQDLAITISKSGAPFDSVDGTVSEIGIGWYQIALRASDCDTLGTAIIHITGSGADTIDVLVEFVSYDVFYDGAAVITTLVDIQESITDLSTTLTPPDPMILP
jgi:hypothetical protein